ncbi:hypothetical protein [Chitinophaga ginsengisoli]|uniref:Uncharacterized protein n=1 Tax=Chitinophaga ginsengisoli TaxID=363837 RepID=A0A2P8GLA4_9BACT|nr:hypothetical protein [Chitinophaga ginsengisoli]PSL34736.1 hypothetical protein CLV42_102309 [Chitinophaga ginsengisoli]
MSYFTWKEFKQPASIISGYFVLAGILTLSSCKTESGYDPAPRGGAEYRFEEGLRREKKPQYLFDKKTRKEMAKMGYPTGEPNAAPPAPGGGAKIGMPAKTDAKKVAPVDSLRMDSVYKVRPQ